MNLFGMAKLVAGDEFEPSVEIEHAEVGMRKGIGREISRFCFVEERESSFANSAEGGEHGIFFSEKRAVDGKRRLQTADAIFGQEEREAEALQERDGARRVAEDAVGVGDDAGFDLAEMSYDVGGGPGVCGRRSLPLIQRDGVDGSEEAGLGGEEFGAEGVEVWHLKIQNRRGSKVNTGVKTKNRGGGVKAATVTNASWKATVQNEGHSVKATLQRG